MRLRGRMLAIAGCALALGARPTAAQRADLPELLLVRCAPASGLACLAASLNLSPDAARMLGRAPAALADTGWRVWFRGDTAAPAFGRRAVSEAPRPVRVLLLVDVSGSMRANLGIGFVKLAVKDHLLRPLDSLARGSVRVAVAPFGSLAVERRIAGARFVAPAEAAAQVEALPAPDRENTALYSAMSLGADRLERELADAGEGALGVLVVITDGDNDVRPGDDPGLLAGDAGLSLAAERLARSPVVPWIVGIGSRVSGGPLARLAGAKGRSTVVPIDAFELARPLAELRPLFATAWEVALRVPLGGREELGRGWALAAFRHLAAGREVQAGAVWRPPVIALPAFSGVVGSGVVPAGLAASSGTLSRRVPLLLFVLVLLALLWLVVPRLLWPRPALAGAPAPVAEKKARAAGGLRTGITEAPPRRPQDVTAGKARGPA